MVIVENQKVKRVKTLQSEKDLEHSSHEFDEFMKKRGITYRLKVPYNPKQKRRAERINITLLDITRCLLFHKFWTEAVNIDHYSQNHLFQRALMEKDFMSYG